MSKKFILKWRGVDRVLMRATVVCDDQDAYLFRSYAYRVQNEHIGVGRSVVRPFNVSSRGSNTTRPFSHDIFGVPPYGSRYYHLDGDPLNLRRSNLKLMTVSEGSSFVDKRWHAAKGHKMSSHANV